MPQDAFTLQKTAAELNALLRDGKVNKITQPSQDEIILFLYTRFGTAKLSVCVSAIGTRVGLTGLEKKNPVTPPAFCMLLRKHLSNATLQSIETIRGERIIKLAFNGKNDFLEDVSKELYCEIMGKYSNAILCENGIIAGTLKPVSFDLKKERALLPGIKYTLPKSQGKKDITNKAEFESVLKNFGFGNLSEFIFNNFQGLSVITATELTLSFYGRENFESPVNSVPEFHDFIIGFLNSPTSRSNVLLRDGKPVDFYFTDYTTIHGEKKYFDNLTDAETYYFDNKYITRTQSELKNRLLASVKAALKKEEKKLQIIAEKELASADAEKYRRAGELITANIYKIRRGDKTVTVEDYYNGNAPVEIPLDNTISPNANAQKYFKKYVKLKNTLKAVIPQKEQITAETEYLKSVLSEINSAITTEDLDEITAELKVSGIIKSDEPIKKKRTNEKISYRTFEYDGHRIFAGKNNIQNDKLTAAAKPSDMWLHTKDSHSAHVVIESTGKHIEGDVLLIAAEICAFYSEASKSDKVSVDYTLKKYVKKPPQAKFGSVLYTNFKTICVTPNSHKNLEK